ncbi:MAG: hypothetical protein PHS41_09705 [Victivallaceae bacterium]|nr:hypothetical protein [Victivallaceae bacterium]
MSQLKMFFPATSVSMPKLEIASGFTLRPLLDTELDAYNQLRASVEFSPWTQTELATYRKKVLPQSLLVIEENATGKLAASAGAETTDLPEHPEYGVLGWVMTHPGFAGHHLGRSVSVGAMQLLYRANYRIFTLLTDDFRGPALATYLKLGWRPWLYEADMLDRWQAIAKKMNLEFESLGCMDHPQA